MKSFFKFAFLFLISKTVLAQSIAPSNAPFQQGQAMQFNYSGGTGATTDWIGIYKKNQIPSNVSSTVWQYITTTSGNVTFDGTLDTGFYDIHLFCCDGYTKLASHLNFKVTAQNFQSRLSFYKTSDTLSFYTNSVVIGDKISVYNSSDFLNGILINGAIPLHEKIFTTNLNSSKTHFPPNLSAGEYVGILQSNVGEILNSEAFEVKNAPILPDVITRIGLGSCSGQGSPQPTLNHILTKDIDAFVYHGDNLYIDTYSPTTMLSEYENFITKRIEFQELRASVPLFATWDDHDYGCCDEDKDYSIKVQSQKMFLDFFEEPLNSPRRTQQGIYTSKIIGTDGQKLQIILLDTRYFLDNKRSNNGCGINDYCAWAGPGDVSKTMLGDAQWEWLKNTLLEPADLRMIVSSVQFGSSYHGFEGWTLFPYQRKKMQDLIKETHAEHVFFTSGDMHYSEVSKLNNDADLYPIYDFTASGINSSWPPEINLNRVPTKTYGLPNVSLLEIDWQGKSITYSCYSEQNIERFSHTVPFDEMEFPTNSIHGLDIENSITMQQIPNPSHNFARLVFSEKIEGTLSVFDISGKQLHQIPVINTDFIEIEGLSKGLYFAKMQNNQKIIAHAKIIIN
jgi:alkaline phosphatase D